jgi:hypothetical protein
MFVAVAKDPKDVLLRNEALGELLGDVDIGRPRQAAFPAIFASPINLDLGR